MLFEELSGPDVVIIDDTEREVLSLQAKLKERNIKFEYIKADQTGSQPDLELISNTKLVFLDLYYNTNFGSSFDPYFCAELIRRVIPKGKQYYLVTWTKDPDKTEEVIEALKEFDLAPISYLSRGKASYRTGDNTYDIDKLLLELDTEFEKIKEECEFIGEIIEVAEDNVLINCLLDKEKLISQVRRFDKQLFKNYIDLKVGNFISIMSVTKPGSSLFEFKNESSDLSDFFKKKNLFEGIEDSAFFKEE
jgi:hypothetical protein